MSTLKERLDQLLVAKGFYETRAQALAAILAGKVMVNGLPATKGGVRIPDDSKIAVKAGPQYVSRGGIKLAAALDIFRTEVSGRICLDVGAGEGGFTDALLQRGAAKVITIDVGYGKIHQKLCRDPRVKIVERSNVRYVTADKIYGDGVPTADLAVVDLSFISVKKILTALKALLKDRCELVILVKPQFEALRAEVQRGGKIRRPEIQQRVLEEMAVSVTALGLSVTGVCASPIRGRTGNMEFFLHAQTGGPPLTSLSGRIAQTVSESHTQWD